MNAAESKTAKSSSVDHHDNIVKTDEGSESSACTEDTNSSFDCSSSSSSSSSSDDDHASYNSSSDESDSTAESDGSSPRWPLNVDDQGKDDDDQYSAQVRLWTKRVPIGLGLCPWAMKSQRQGRLRYRTCEGNMPSDVAILILSEAKALVFGCGDGGGEGVGGVTSSSSSSSLPLSSSLVVCPHVTAWNEDFQVFDEFVRGFERVWHEQLSKENLQQTISLVSFHPQFLRWRGLPKGINVGSVVQSHRGMGGFQKSQETYSATVIETGNSVFGLRKIKVRFHDDSKEQYVSTDWLVILSSAPSQPSSSHEESGGGSSGSSGSEDINHDDDVRLGPPLPDNAMHRAPYPTVHLIRNEDLGKMCIRDVSRVKRKNARRMMKLGWEGILRKAATEKEGSMMEKDQKER
jgi:hypothetical protein